MNGRRAQYALVGAGVGAAFATLCIAAVCVPAADAGAANWSTHANPPPTGDGQLLAARREH